MTLHPPRLSAPVTVGDIFIILFCLSLAALAATSTDDGDKEGPLRLVVRIGDGSEQTIPLLASSHRVEFDGPIGRTVIDIEPGRARVSSSPCLQQVCRLAGWLSQSGDLAACVPNRFLARVIGTSGPEPASKHIDAITH